MTEEILVLGLGNLLLGDEGLGVHAAQMLQREEHLSRVSVIDVGTAILDALPALEHADQIIVLDAVKADGKPGTVYQMSLDECRQKQNIASMHGFDLHRALSLVGRDTPPEVQIIGVEPASIGWSLDLSPSVEAALPVVLELVKQKVSAITG